MPPEALTTPPHYSSKLDCFSHGVLIIQIATRNFPKPGDAHQSIEDPNYPSGRILIQLLETERRKEDIDQIEPAHPLLPTALHCIKDRDTDRPSADEVCERLATLKRDERYAHSVEQTRDQVSLVQRLQDELVQKDNECQAVIQSEREYHQAELERESADHQAEIERERADHQMQNEVHQVELERERADHQAEIERERAIYQKELEAKDLMIELSKEETTHNIPTLNKVVSIGKE